MHWPEIACYLRRSGEEPYYNSHNRTAIRTDIQSVVEAYGLFNPHATFTLTFADGDGDFGTRHSGLGTRTRNSDRICTLDLDG